MCSFIRVALITMKWSYAFCKIHNLKERFRFYGENSTLHGWKYVFKKDSDLFSRFFWISILLASNGSVYLLLKSVLLERNHVSFMPDTLYLNWNTTFPAVTVCETYNAKVAQRKLAEHYPNLTATLNFDFRRYLTDLAYGRGSCSRSVCVPCGHDIPCDTPWSNVIRKVHLTCHELLSTCNFNTKDFSCCDEFLPVDSEYGPCYSFNSLQNKYKVRKNPFVVNQKSGPGVLSFRLISDTQISIHSTEELSTNTLDTKFKFDVRTQMENHVDIIFSLIEVENEPVLRLADINKRKCRFVSEIPEGPLHTYSAYSYGACRLAMSTEQSYKICDCIHPGRDRSYAAKFCNFTGLNCLVTYNANRIKLGIDAIPDSDDCWPACEESELTVIHISRRRESTYLREGTLVNIRMSSLPTMRYQKNLLRSNLDFVVSVGGMIGLFFGASILSMLEVFYLTLRARY